MGGGFSCIPCVPAKGDGPGAYSGRADDFENELPLSTSLSSTNRSGRKFASPAERGAEEAAEPDGSARTGSRVADSRAALPGSGHAKGGGALGREPTTVSSSSGLRPSAEGGKFRHALSDVLHDNQLTSLAIMTATVVGSTVGIFTMSGVTGSLAYLFVLVVQLACALLSRMLASRRTRKVKFPVQGGGARALPSKAKSTLPPPTLQTIHSENKKERPRAAAAPGHQIQQGIATELRTKHKYPLVMDEHDGYPEDVELLSGLGIRDKRVALLTIDVYSVGIYVNGPQFKATFGSKYAHLSRQGLKDESDALLADLIQSTPSVSRTIRIEIQFSGLTSKMLVNAFDERLEKVMKDAGETSVYEVLRSGLGSVKLCPGRVILLRMKTDGYLVATSGSEVLANTQSHVLCRAVTDLYLGQYSPSPVLKENTRERMYDTLHCPSLEQAPASQNGEAESAAAGQEERRQPPKPRSDLADLSGTWEVVEAENVEEFMIALGISFIVRKIAIQLYTKDMKIIAQEGKDVSFTDFRNRRRGRPVLFEENKVVERKDKKGTDLTDVAFWEERVLRITTKGYQSPLSTKYWRESEDRMVSETSVDGTTMRRVWRIMQEDED